MLKDSTIIQNILVQHFILLTSETKIFLVYVTQLLQESLEFIS
jgi:hypothetical protein